MDHNDDWTWGLAMNYFGSHRRRLTASLAIAVLAATVALCVPARALAGSVAATTAASSSVTSTTTNPVPYQTAPAGSFTLKFGSSVNLGSLFHVKGTAVSVPGFRTVLNGNVAQYVAGQTVTVTLKLDHKTFRTATVRVLPDRKGSGGWFRFAYSVPRSGSVTVTVEHAATAQQDGYSATRGYLALNENVKPGARGRFVELIQQRLRALHFYLPASGVYDAYTELALDAYHRLIGWGVSDGLGRATVNHLLLGLGRFHVRYPNQGMHAEGDLSDQVLALINGSQVEELFPISSGKPSTPTILGSFRVYYKVAGYLPDGMYYSSFFYTGYAIHGYDPAPNYPASHGCMRLPIIDAIAAYNWVEVGDWVDTYYT